MGEKKTRRETTQTAKEAAMAFAILPQRRTAIRARQKAAIKRYDWIEPALGLAGEAVIGGESP